MTWLDARKLHLILLLGLSVRLLFVFTSDHLYYPDELFQVLEQGYRWVYGYGLVPWDIDHGLRSWVLPGVVAGLLKGLAWFGCDLPSCYSIGVRLWWAILSTSLVWSMYGLSMALYAKQRLALLTALVGAIWYEVVYFSTRLLSEVIATYLLMGGLAMVCHRKWSLFAGLLLGLGSMLRIQYGLVLIIWFIIINGSQIWGRRSAWGNEWVLPWSLRFGHWQVRVVGGVAIAVAGYGLVDWLVIGQWYGSHIQNIRLSYLLGLSHVFGTQPWYFFVYTVLIGSAGSYLGLLGRQRFNGLHGLILGTFALHSLFGHKEYRFVFLVIPLLWIVLIPVLDEWVARWFRPLVRGTLIGGMAGVVSILGMVNQLPYQDQVYSQPLLSHNLTLRAYQWLPTQKQLCGFYDLTNPWVHTGGYYNIGRAVPLYSQDYPPKHLGFVNYILSRDPLSSPWQIKKRIGDLYIYSRERSCEIDPDYSSYRSFAEVEAMLKP